MAALRFPERVIPVPDNPAVEIINPLKVAVNPDKVPLNVTPPEAHMPEVNLVSAPKVPPAEEIPLVKL